MTFQQAQVLAVQIVATEGMEDTVAMEDTVEDQTSLEDPSLRTCVTSVAREATGPGSAPIHREVRFFGHLYRSRTGIGILKNSEI